MALNHYFHFQEGKEVDIALGQRLPSFITPPCIRMNFYGVQRGYIMLLENLRIFNLEPLLVLPNMQVNS